MTIRSVLEDTGELVTRAEIDGVTIKRKQWQNSAGYFLCGFWQLDDSRKEIHLICFEDGKTEQEAIENMKKWILSSPPGACPP